MVVYGFTACEEKHTKSLDKLLLREVIKNPSSRQATQPGHLSFVNVNGVVWACLWTNRYPMRETHYCIALYIVLLTLNDRFWFLQKPPGYCTLYIELSRQILMSSTGTCLTTVADVSLSFAEFPPELKEAFLTPLIKKIIIDWFFFKELQACVWLIVHFKACWTHCLCSTSRASENQQLVCTEWPPPRSGQWEREHFNTARSECGTRNRYKLSKLQIGVPQVSAIGPILFTIYKIPLGNIIRKHGLSFNLYADDTQLYKLFQPGASVSTMYRLEAWIQDTKIWLANNLLKLND